MIEGLNKLENDMVRKKYDVKDLIPDFFCNMKSPKEMNEKTSAFLPRTGGEWSGKPGNSEWKPNREVEPGDRNGTNPEHKSWGKIMEKYEFESIPFNENKPDFSEVSKGEVQIGEFTDNRRKNFVQADEKLAEQKGYTPNEVREWRNENRYTWHESADCKTMQKVPSEVHGNIPHDGGISEYKERSRI